MAHAVPKVYTCLQPSWRGVRKSLWSWRQHFLRLKRMVCNTHGNWRRHTVFCTRCTSLSGLDGLRVSAPKDLNTGILIWWRRLHTAQIIRRCSWPFWDTMSVRATSSTSWNCSRPDGGRWWRIRTPACHSSHGAGWVWKKEVSKERLCILWPCPSLSVVTVDFCWQQEPSNPAGNTPPYPISYRILTLFRIYWTRQNSTTLMMSFWITGCRTKRVG